MLRFGLLLLMGMVTMHLAAADYYWVGGTGNWSDISKWRTTSGGPIQHVQVPTSADDVYFDANSFPMAGGVVTLNQDNQFCRNLIWTDATGRPTLSGAMLSTLQIYGELSLIAEMDFAVLGDLIFQSTLPDQGLDFAGHGIAGNVFFNSTTGGWILESDLIIEQELLLDAGTLNTNGQAVEALRLMSNVTDARTLILGASQIAIHGEEIGPYSERRYPIFLHMDNLTIPASTATINLTAQNANIGLRGNASVVLPEVIFSATGGTAQVVIYRENPTIGFNHLHFMGNGMVEGVREIESLTLSQGKSYTFEAGVTCALDQIQAQGTCENSILLRSSIAGSASTFSSANALQVDFVAIRDIAFSGSGSATATNSSDLGNNPGWDFPTLSGRDLYWVGGRGDWSDAAHWSLTEGGAGGECPPTSVDNVFFTGSSLPQNQSLNIDVQDAYCRDFIWDNTRPNAGMEGASNRNIHIYGSIQLDDRMNFSFLGAMRCEGIEDNTIESNNVEFPGQLYFDGEGSWNLVDPLSVEDSIVHSQGALITNSHDVRAEFYISRDPTPRRLELGSTHFLLEAGENNRVRRKFELNPRQFNLLPGTSLIELEAVRAELSVIGGEVRFHNVLFSNEFQEAGLGEIGFRQGAKVAGSRLEFRSDAQMGGQIDFQTVVFAADQRYVMRRNDTMFVEEIISQADCGSIILLESPFGEAYISKTGGPLEIENFAIRNITGLGPSFTANESFDRGGNTNWIFNAPEASARYWVGGDGDWHDSANWSDRSGGQGGACIPTLVNDVFFDQQSFSAAGQTIVNEEIAYCRSMAWEGVRFQPTFRMRNDLHIGGALRFDRNMTSLLGSLHFVTDSLLQGIDFAGHRPFKAIMSGGGSWQLQDSIYANSSIDLYSGHLFSNGRKINVSRIWNQGGINSAISLEDSYVILRTGSVGALALAGDDGNIFDPGTSTIEFTHEEAVIGYLGSPVLMLHNVLFSHPEGNPRIIKRLQATDYSSRINRLEFRGNGYMEHLNTVDTLIMTAGKSYWMESNKEQIVNEHWQIRGNNCAPITLSSTVAGAAAFVIKSQGDVQGDFIQMTDITARGGALFNAGPHSTDVGNSNVGWDFPPLIENTDVGLLGEDQALCGDDPIILDANSFTAGETYEWDDGSRNQTREITAPGIYFVNVSFLNNCTLPDTIEVFDIPDLTPNLGPDTTICNAQNYLLTAPDGPPGTTYSWQDGSGSPQFTVEENGLYSLTVQVSTCLARDTVLIEFLTLPEINLGPDQDLCRGQDLALDADLMVSGASYLWQDGSTDAQFVADAAGLYVVDVRAGACHLKDSIVLSLIDLPALDLGRDTALCEGQELQLQGPAGAQGLEYAWQDGSTAETFMVDQAGQFVLEIKQGACTDKDTLMVSYISPAQFTLGPDATVCNDENIRLGADLGVTGAEYLWQDGSTNAQFLPTATGIYWVEVGLASCSTRDSIELAFIDPPTVNLGQDQALCASQSLELTAGAIPSVTYLWSTGSSDPTIVASSAGEYWVQIDNGTCARADTLEISVIPVAEIDLGADTTLCLGQFLTLDATATGATQLWSDGSSQSTIQVDQAGSIWVEVTRDNCATRDTINVDVLDLNSPLLDDMVSLCEGSLRVVRPLLTGLNYQWSDGSQADSLVIREGGIYQVEGSLAGCSQRDTIEAVLFSRPLLDLGSDTTVCDLADVQLDLSAAMGTIIWDDGSSQQSRLINDVGMYWAEITDANGCQARDSIFVSREFALPIDLGRDTSICDNAVFELSIDPSSFSTFSWNTGSSDPSLNIENAGTYILSAFDGFCESRDTIVVDLRMCNSFSMYVPNAFSPDGNGVNDVFFAEVPSNSSIVNFDMQIFDRWGNRVFQSDNLTDGWTGQRGGDKYDVGVYVYAIKVEYVDDNGPGLLEQAGDVNLLR